MGVLSLHSSSNWPGSYERASNAISRTKALDFPVAFDAVS